MKFFKSNPFWLFYTICLVPFAFSLFFGWGLMVGTLFTIFWFFRLTGMESELDYREQVPYWLTMLLYTPLETSVQWAVTHRLIPSDFTWVNRLEHSCWATMLAFLFLPILAKVWKRLTLWQNFLFVLGFVCLLGNLNEFLEFYFRIQPPISQAQFARWYSDTIYDMMMNLLGGCVGFVFLVWLEHPFLQAQNVEGRLN